MIINQSLAFDEKAVRLYFEAHKRLIQKCWEQSCGHKLTNPKSSIKVKVKAEDWGFPKITSC